MLNEFLQRNTDGIVTTDENGEFKIYDTKEFMEDIAPNIKKVDYIGFDLAIVILHNGQGLRVEAL